MILKGRKMPATRTEPLTGTRLTARTTARYKLPDAKFDRLAKMIEEYIAEYDVCRRNRAYCAACILLGAACEGMLLMMCYAYPEEADSAVRSLPSKRRPRGQPVDWDFDKLWRVAKQAAWLPVRGSKYGRPKAGDWVEFVKELRNMVHPGMHLREYPKVRVRRAHAQQAWIVLDAVRSWLEARVVADLEKALADETRPRKAERRFPKSASG